MEIVQDSALSCALFQGVVQDGDVGRVFENLVAKVESHGGRIDAGILGAKYLLDCLSEHGRTDVAYGLVAQEGFPGWGYWMRQGASTLWEDWRGAQSRNHIMFGDVRAWFFKWLAGIQPDPEAPGFRHVILRPGVVDDLSFVHAEYESIRGWIVSRWERDGSRLRLEVTLPPGAGATVWIPFSRAPRQRGPSTDPGMPPVGIRIPPAGFRSPAPRVCGQSR